jgi:hypothetical protein
MRGIMISIAIIAFCFSMGMINSVDTQHEAVMNQSILYSKSEPPIKPADLGDVADASSFNNTLYSLTEQQEQPAGLIDSLWSMGTWIVKGVKFIGNTLINSSVNFGPWVQSLGRDDVVLFPDYMTIYFTCMVMICHIFTIIQILLKFKMSGGL